MLSPGGPLRRATQALSLLSGICLLFMVVVITVSVLTRYLFNAPLLGANEIVQMTGVCVIMLALPHATADKVHVRVDMFDPFLGRIGCLIGDVAARLLAGFILCDLVRRAYAKTLDAWDYADTTNMLGLPVWPFYAALTLGAALCVLVFLSELLTLLITRRPL